MAIIAFTPAKSPTLGKTAETSYRTLDAGFGDGYSQTTIDGLNATMDTVTLVWKGLLLADQQSIKAQFDSFAGMTFSYKVPGDTVIKLWRCKKVTTDDSDGTLMSMTAQLQQAFD